jgi:hypothetical protein
MQIFFLFNNYILKIFVSLKYLLIQYLFKIPIGYIMLTKVFILTYSINTEYKIEIILLFKIFTFCGVKKCRLFIINNIIIIVLLKYYK